MGIMPLPDMARETVSGTNTAGMALWKFGEAPETKRDRVVNWPASQLTIDILPPSATIMARGQQVESWNLAPITKALQSGIIPVGDADFVNDQELGGTILSPEELFYHLAAHLKPDSVLLAGIEKAVFADFPANQKAIRHIDKNAPLDDFLQGSQNQDVTGGMRSKVCQMQALCRQSEACQVEIFRATNTGELLLALKGQHSGTIIS